MSIKLLEMRSKSDITELINNSHKQSFTQFGSLSNKVANRSPLPKCSCQSALQEEYPNYIKAPLSQFHARNGN